MRDNYIGNEITRECTLCPRRCGVDRTSGSLGFCGEGYALRVARIAPHYFEEPPISGKRGSGAIFFSGCSLRCVFCQNRDISRHGGNGRVMSDGELYDAMIALSQSGVHNINLVTPTHFLHRIIPLLERAKTSGELRVPVVYNTSGYESVESLKRLEGLVDIYMPDLKYYSSDIAEKYSKAPAYLTVASAALLEMHRQVRGCVYSQEEPDILAKGLIVRHLVLPSHRHDSMAVLEHLAKLLPADSFLLSLMSQYTPEFALDTPYRELHRRVTSFEYGKVAERAAQLGFEGFIQERSSANKAFTPNFKE